MKDYIEKCLRRSITIEENKEILKKLPLKYAGSYNVYSIFMDEIEWITIQPKMEIRLNTLRYDQKQIQKVSGLNCAFYFKKLSYYCKETMMNEGIPFIIEGKQMYLPFLGMILTNREERKLEPVYEISFLTQKLLLCALYERWKNMSVTKIAERLGVSKMSISRCFDEIEYLDIDILDTTGNYRKITVVDEPKELWQKILPILRNPIIRTYEFVEDVMLQKKAGITALCEYSMLADNLYPTYAITKKDFKEFNPKKFRKVSLGEEKGSVVLELGYFIDYMEKGIQDPLSVWMCISDKEKEDERIEMSIDEMLEEYVW